nr:homeodomain HD1 [Ganoderma boninense]
MSSLRDRLLLAEEDFLTSLTDGTDSAIRAFEVRWESVVHDVNLAADTNDLDEETSVLAHVVATRMSHIAETATDLFASYNTLTVQLVDQLDGLMSELTLEDVATTCVVPRPPRSRSCSLQKPTILESSSTCHGKRRRTTAENDSQLSSTFPQPKRQRFWSAPPASSLCPGIPRPCDEDTVVSMPAPPLTSHACSASRKRRLSEADVAGSSCKRMHTGPRLPSVSVIQQAPRYPPISDNSLDTSSAILGTSIQLDIQPLVTSCADLTTNMFDIGDIAPLVQSDEIDPSSFMGHGCFDQLLTSLLHPHNGETALQLPPLHDDHWFPGDTLLATLPMSTSPSSNNSPLSNRSLSLPPTTPVDISLDAPLPQYEVECVNPHASNEHYGFDLESLITASAKPCLDPPPAWSGDPCPPPPFLEIHYAADWCSMPGPPDPLPWLSTAPPPYELSSVSCGTSSFESEDPVGNLRRCPQVVSPA